MKLTYDEFYKDYGKEVAREFVAGQVKGVQEWMALDLYMALGYGTDPKEEWMDGASWADRWADLLGEVRHNTMMNEKLSVFYERNMDDGR